MKLETGCREKEFQRDTGKQFTYSRIQAAGKQILKQDMERESKAAE